MLSGLGYFGVDCPIKSTSSTSVFANHDVPEKQSNIICNKYNTEFQ